MNKNILIIVTCLSIFYPSASHAAEFWTGNRTVKSIQAVSHGGFVIYFEAEVNSSCTAAGTNSVYVYSGQFNVTNEGVQSLLAITLSAFHAGNKINVNFEDSSIYCWSRQIQISK